MVRLYEVLISLAVIVVVTWIGDRFRGVAGVIASMPLTIPLTMAIVYWNTGRDPAATAEFAGAAIAGIVATACFTVAAYLGLRWRWPFAGVILGGYGAWAAALLLWQLLHRLLTRGGA